MRIKNAYWLLLATLAASTSSLAQGTVSFKNRDTAAGVDARFFLLTWDGAIRLSGPYWVAQLWAGPTAADLAPIGAECPFRTGAGAGYWDPAPDSTRVIPTVAPGATAFVEVRVWFKCEDTTTLDQVVARGGLWMRSPIFTVVTGGTDSPPSPPAPLVGLTSFSILMPVCAPSRVVMIRQPEDQARGLGQAATFSVETDCSPSGGGCSCRFQWQKSTDNAHWADIDAGIGKASLTIPAVVRSDAGFYRVTVCDSSCRCSATSRSATLRVIEPPRISIQSVSLSDGLLRVSTDVPPDLTLTFQWSDDLLSWADLPNLVVEPGTGFLVLPISSGTPAGFFRVVVP